MQKINAIQILQPGHVDLIQIESSGIQPDEVQLKLHYVGFCGSDLSTFTGKNPMVSYPRIPGHEIAGEILRTGSRVPGEYKAGMKVTVNPYTHCGQCASCRQKRYNACENNETYGVQRDGAMREIINVPWEKLIRGDKLSSLELTLVEPLTVGFHAVSRAMITDLDTVMIMGCGMIGAGAIIRATLRGAHVVAVDIDDQKLDLARKLGADELINSMHTDLHEKLERITAGDGPDVVIEAAGNPLTYQQAIREVSFSGRVVCIGYAPGETGFPTALWVKKELDIRGSRNADTSDFEAVTKYLKESELDTGALITSIIKPEKALETLKDWSESPSEYIKILVQFN